MAYTDDAVLAKLSALNETHDSIATAAQWIMFHRRHAERTVQLWFQRLKDSPSPKRLNLIYLANEVTQQSKARHKEDFVVAFSPVIAEAIASAYKGAPSEVQTKLRRVVDVWHDRSIFEAPIQAAVEGRIEELDKAKGTSRTGLGGSIFGSGSGGSAPAPSFPPELASLVAPQQNVNKLLLSTQGNVSKADADYQKVMNSPPPADSVHAARLNGLQKTLAHAEDTLKRLIHERTELANALASLHVQAQKALEADLQHLRELQERRLLVDSNKQAVEDKILKGLNGIDNHSAGPSAGSGPIQEPQRPEVEALTPPPNDSDEPQEPVFPGVEPSQSEPKNAVAESSLPPEDRDLRNTESAPPPHTVPVSTPSVSGIDILSQLASQASPASTNGANKRRRLNPSDEVPDLGDAIDADVTEALLKDRQAA